jgi:protein tyrosine/serine phosphatase
MTSVADIQSARLSLGTPQGRRRAWRELMLGDHGILRKFYDNTHEIAQGKMWRTYQPSPADLKKWKTRGVKTVVNLRGETAQGYFVLEEEACRNLGLNIVSLCVFSREAPSLEVLRGARKLFDEIDYPAVMHCKSGADRAGLMATLYLFFHEGRPLDEAMEQLSFKYGHIRQGKTGVIDCALERYVAYARRHGKSLSSVEDFFAWAQAHYDPVQIKKTYLGNWWGNILTEKIFRRE